MSESPHEQCFTVSTSMSETLKHLPEEAKQPRNTTETPSLKSLAKRVLSAHQEAKQPRNITETEVFHSPLDTQIDGNTETFAATELQASHERLESQRLTVAIQEDGTARVIHTDARLVDGEVRYTPREMMMYVRLSEHDRRLLHSFKKTYGGEAKLEP